MAKQYGCAAAWVLGLGMVCAVCAAQDAKTLAIGSSVEVLWGATWYPSSIVKVEGARYLIHYTGWPATDDEWVTADRVRTVGEVAGNASGGAAAATQPATASSGSSVDDRDVARWREQDAWQLEQWKQNNERRKKMGFPPLPKPDSIEQWHKEVADRRAKEAAASAAAAAEAKAKSDSYRKNMREVAPEGGWSYVPDPGTGLQAVSTHVIPLRGGRGGASESPQGLLVSGNRAAVSHIDWRLSGGVAPQVEILDLAVRGTKKLLPLPQGMTPIAMSADGTRLLCKCSEGFGKVAGKLAVLDISGSAACVVASWEPYGARDWSMQEARWTAFLDNDHVLTSPGGSVLTMWQVHDTTAVWEMKIASLTTPILSPGRKYVAVDTQTQLCLVDAMAGTVAGSLPASTSGFAFSPDGKKAVTLGPTLRVWDLQQGVLLDSYAIGNLKQIVASMWVTPDLVLIGQRDLFDLRTGRNVWSYEVTDMQQLATEGGKIVAIVRQGGRQYSVVALAVPSSEVLGAIAKAPEPQSVFRQGAVVSIELNIDSAEKEKAVAALTKQLSAMGVRVAENQDVKIVGQVTPGESKEIQYRMWDRSRDIQKVNFQEMKTRMAIEVAGKTAWETVGVDFAPTMVSLKKGQSIDDAVKETRSKPDQWFATVTLPAIVLRPEDQKPMGTTKLGANGSTESH